MLGTYQRGLYFEKIGQFKRAAKEYQKGFTQSEVGDLTKDYILKEQKHYKGKRQRNRRTKTRRRTKS